MAAYNTVRDECVSIRYGSKVFMDAHQPVTLKEGDRYPLGPPILFRKTRARCMGVTVNHWLVEFDSLMRSQIKSVPR